MTTAEPETTTTTGTGSPVLLGKLSLRRNQRGLVVGGTGSGKSTLEEQLLNDWLLRYPPGKDRRTPGSRLLLLDTKPRFRAEWERTGASARRRYRHWDHGPFIPGSILVERPDDLSMAWKLGHRVAIAQGESSADIGWIVRIAERFLRTSRASIPQLLVVDETLDFFSSNGQARGGNDVLLRVARAGRERGTAGLYCAQRSKGIPQQLISELTKLYLFHLDNLGDEKRLVDCGVPAWIEPPEDDHNFYFWTKEHRRNVYGPFRLALG